MGPLMTLWHYFQSFPEALNDPASEKQMLITLGVQSSDVGIIIGGARCERIQVVVVFASRARDALVGPD